MTPTRFAALIRWIVAGIVTVLWILPAGSTPLGGWIYGAMVDVPEGLVSGQWNFAGEFSEAYVHRGAAAFTPLWPIAVLLAGLAALLVVRLGILRRWPAWTRSTTFLAVVFFVVYRDLVIAPPCLPLEYLGQSLVYGGFLTLLLSPRRSKKQFELSVDPATSGRASVG